MSNMNTSHINQLSLHATHSPQGLKSDLGMERCDAYYIIITFESG